MFICRQKQPKQFKITSIIEREKNGYVIIVYTWPEKTLSAESPNIEDKLKNGDIALVINTSDNKSSKDDAKKIRQAVLRFKIPYFTTVAAAAAATTAIEYIQDKSALEPRALQDFLN